MDVIFNSTASIKATSDFYTSTDSHLKAKNKRELHASRPEGFGNLPLQESPRLQIAPWIAHSSG